MKFNRDSEPYNGNEVEKLSNDLHAHHLYEDGEHIDTVVVDVSKCCEADNEGNNELFE